MCHGKKRKNNPHFDSYNFRISTSILTLEMTMFMIYDCQLDEAIWDPKEWAKLYVEFQSVHHKPTFLILVHILEGDI